MQLFLVVCSSSVTAWSSCSSDKYSSVSIGCSFAVAFEVPVKCFLVAFGVGGAAQQTWEDV